MLHAHREQAVRLIQKHQLRVSDIARLSRVPVHTARVSDFINDRPLDAGRERAIIAVVEATDAVLDFYKIPVDIAADPHWLWKTAEKLAGRTYEDLDVSDMVRATCV